MGGGGGKGWFGGTRGGTSYGKTRAEAKSNIKSLPQSAQQGARNMHRSTKSQYQNFSYKRLPNGNHVYRAENPGIVPGSKAVYYKEVNPQGKTVRFYKETIDPKGNLVHTKEKRVGK